MSGQMVGRTGVRWLGLGLGLLLALPGVAQAAVLTVTNTNDAGSGSLRAAVAASASGDTIDFAPGLTGTITLTSGALVVPHSLTISGPGASSLTVDGGGANTVFDIEAGNTQPVTIAGLTITGGSFSTADDSGGGGIFDNSASVLTLSGVVVTGNSATVATAFGGGGGGVYANGSRLTVTNSTITNNSLTLTNADGGNGGGGIYSNGGVTTITGSVVSDNSVNQSATSSSGSDGGGGIYSDGGATTVTNTVVQDNTDRIDSSPGGSDGGGGIYSNGGALTLTGDNVDGNAFSLGAASGGDNGGGGVYSAGGDVSLTSSSIDANRMTLTDSSTGGADGGGGLFGEGGALAITASSIAANTGNVTASTGYDGGGAVLDEGRSGVYLNSTFSSNSLTITSSGSNTGGGAIFAFGGGAASDSTIAGNQVNQAGGGIFSLGTFRLKNTIISSNTATPAGNCAAGIASAFSSAGFNLEDANTCSLSAAGDLVNTDPKLGPLQNNGGFTLTQALAANSPAVDAGSCTDLSGNPVSTDQRGVPRPQPAGGRCDIGAYELVPTAPPTSQPSPPSAVPAAPAATSSTGAAFSGSVNPEGQATTVFFQYGIDARFRPGGGTAVVYDQSTAPQTLPADSNVHAVSASAAGLIPNALYHVRLVATNATGTTFGPDQTFTTPAGSAPPPPVIGRSVNASPVSGQVFVLVGTKLVPLTELSALPSGTIVDARAGSLQLTAATGTGHKHETGVFGGAIFKLTQSGAGASRGLTTLSLVESAFAGAPSYGTCRPAHAVDASAPGASAAALSSRTLQLLHASAHGRFRTSGHYSSATVRGTKWTIADRCDGTLTHDLTDSVAVSDFIRHKTIILHGGQSYLAKAPRRG